MAKSDDNTQLILFENELEALAKLEQQAEKATGQVFLSTKGGVLSYRDTPVAGNALEVVILASPVERLYYTTRYDPTNPTGPVCFAMSTTTTGMKPSASSTEPQSETCANCPKDIWGSAPGGGKGKACAEKRRLLIMTADSTKTASSVNLAEVAALRIPVTSVKGFATYLQSITTVTKRPLSTVVTKISLTPDAKTQFKLQFDFVRVIDDMEVARALIGRVEQEVSSAMSQNTADTGAEATPDAATSSKF